MKFHRIILHQLVIAGCVVFFSCVTLNAQTGKVFFNPDTTKVSTAETFEVNIEVDSNLTGIHCFQVSVQFDRSLVQLDSVFEGPLLLAHSGTWGTWFQWNDNGVGYDIVNCLMHHGLYADGPGVLAIMKFRTDSRAGVTPLTFSGVVFVDANLDTIDVSYSNGAVVVSGEEVPLLQPETTLVLFLLFLLTGTLFIKKLEHRGRERDVR